MKKIESVKIIDTAKIILVGDTEIKPIATLDVDGEIVHLWKADTIFMAGVDRGGKVITDHPKKAIPKKAGIDIQYTGKRDNQKEPVFGTGYWSRGQIKTVPLPVAISLLREFPDSYARVVTEDVEPAVADHKEEDVSQEVIKQEDLDGKAEKDQVDEDELQAARDTIATMTDIEEIREYVLVNFGQKLNHLITKPETGKQHALTLLEQYGLP